MARFSLYGSSPSELAQQQQNYDRFFLGAAESNRAAAERAAIASLNAQIQAQQADEAAMERDTSRNLGLWKYGQEVEARNRAERFDLAKYGDALATQGRTEALNREKFEADKVFSNKQLDINMQRFKPVDTETARANELGAVLESLNASAAKLQADKVGKFIAAATKAKNGQPPSRDEISAAATLNDYELAALKASAGNLGDSLYHNPITGRFQLNKPENMAEFVPDMGKVSRDLTAYQDLKSQPAPNFPQWSNQGGGYIPPTKRLTPEIALAYKQRFGSREAAETAAQSDGYTWPR